MERPIFTVSQLNDRVKGLLDGDGLLAHVAVRGELSNYKTYPSGHHYFSLKDADATLRCVLFRREAAALRFRPQNGVKVVALGRVTVFPRDGQYQLYCTQLIPDGVGELHVAYEQCKAKLQAEGLFDPAHKQPILPYPQTVALITSSAGAAVRDMLRVLNARWPMAAVRLLPVRVQGAEAPGELCAALDFADRHQAADLIILGRGGGSMEDLWAFNDEAVARAIYRCGIPVISAVGHEPDFTIADFVADLRAATPSNGAELAVPDRAAVLSRLKHLEARMTKAALRTVGNERANLTRLGAAQVLRDPVAPLQDRRLLVDYQQRRLMAGLEQTVHRDRARLGKAAAALDALSPLKVLGRGYAIATLETGEVLTRSSQVAEGDTLSLRLAKGTVSCRVESTTDVPSARLRRR